SVCVELCTSPSTTTISGFSSPNLARATPKASRTDFPIFMSHILDRSFPRIQECQRLGLFFFGQRLAVMIRVAEQVLDWVSLHRSGHDGAWLALGLGGLLKSG